MRSRRPYKDLFALEFCRRIRLCGPLCDLRASVVSAFSINSTTETPSSTESAQRNPFPVRLLVAIVIVISFSASTASAQTSSFTYQGRLTDGGTPANGNYDLQFALWDSLSGGVQVGSTQALNTVAVSNGVFTVTPDFGANAFPGASRFLEISARPSGGGSFTLLSPRQPITPTPYAIRSLNASSADSVPASGVPACSGNYIQNSTSPQSSSNFSISGNGTAGGTLSGGVVNATTQYNLNGTRILSNAGLQNLFVGIGAGQSNTGLSNSFFGFNAGASNTGGASNSFFGLAAGAANTTGQFNAFFGEGAGTRNTLGFNNSFFGARAGFFNTVGDSNAFFGTNAGHSNTTGAGNVFFGRSAGESNVIGASNSYFGSLAGRTATGNSNTFIGALTDFDGSSSGGERNTLLGAFAKLGTGPIFSPNNATAIGANARVDNSNSIVLGSINGVNGATADTNVGIGTTAPTARLSVIATGDGARVLHLGTERGWVFKQLGTVGATALELTGENPNNNNKNFVINTEGNVGIGTTTPQAKLEVFGDVRFFPSFSVAQGQPGVVPLCQFITNNDRRIIQCPTSSSLRYKSNVTTFVGGLEIVKRLRPISFTWKTTGMKDIGLGAEEVEKFAPLLTFNNDKGEIEGVRYNQLSAVFINAFKEQQVQIATLQQVNSVLNARLHKIERALRKKSYASRRR